MQELAVSTLTHFKRYDVQVLCAEEDTKDKGKLYKPQSRIALSQDLSTAEKAQAYAKLLAGDRKPERLGKKKNQTKSNLESFKEELRQ